MTGSMILLLCVLLAICFEPPVYAHVSADGTVVPDWHWRWDVIAVLAVFAALYVRGWLRLRKIGGDIQLRHLLFYALALIAVGSALLSPLDDLASYLLIAHMAQHELLMMVAPPLILLAKPVPVLMWGLGESFRIQTGHVLSRNSMIRRGRDLLAWMPVAWCLYVVNLWAWHYPVFYEAALNVRWIHDLEHILFFLTALVFWWPVILPVSQPAPVQYGVRIVYLFLAATQDAFLAGLIALSSEILYPHYQTALRLWDLTARQDQVGGGIVMFAAGSAAYTVAVLFTVNGLLSEGRTKRSAERSLGDRAEKVEGRV